MLSLSYDGEETGDEGGDEILSGPGAHDRVVGAGDGGSVIGRDHQTHLQEFACIRRKSALQKEEEENMLSTF